MCTDLANCKHTKCFESYRIACVWSFECVYARARLCVFHLLTFFLSLALFLKLSRSLSLSIFLSRSLSFALFLSCVQSKLHEKGFDANQFSICFINFLYLSYYDGCKCALLQTMCSECVLEFGMIVWLFSQSTIDDALD